MTSPQSRHLVCQQGCGCHGFLQRYAFSLMRPRAPLTRQ
jgi:hypothetical protein